ncbi:hypothetical protein [Micromonospora cremea]|uniref:Uncharacterized protein n=1 Tax=Micromonospora cremea TaxID=709881 RepID=A0A1N5ZV68_9ACTN|nr:hypothetical protein [Micromonospora cremea]SIN25669.1 hypothetical protein SAMN04489832_4496 [Micromonospora cremea]
MVAAAGIQASAAADRLASIDALGLAVDGWKHRPRAEGVAMATRRTAIAGIVGVLMLPFGFGAVIAGLVALLGGLLSSDDGPATCDGEVMRPTDWCNVVRDGRGELVSYEGMVRRKESSPRDGLIIGGTFLAGGTVLLLGGRSLLRRDQP